MVDISALKKNRAARLEKLQEQTKKLNKTNFESDTRYWYPKVDETGNNYCEIRFLPEISEDDAPYVRLFEHSFKGPTGQWYIENSLKTIGKPDPVLELNSVLWNSVDDDKHPIRDQVRSQSLKARYIANIYVIRDKNNPENEGKVFKFKFGPKIFAKVEAAMKDDPDTGEAGWNPFDLWDGATLRLKIRTVAKRRNYDESSLAPRGPLFKDDDKLQEIMDQAYDLKEDVAADKFKTYDALKERLNAVLGKGASKPTPAAQKRIEEEAPWQDEAPAPKAKAAPEKALPKKAEPAEEEDEDMAFFAKLGLDD